MSKAEQEFKQHQILDLTNDFLYYIIDINSSYEIDMDKLFNYVDNMVKVEQFTEDEICDKEYMNDKFEIWFEEIQYRSNGVLT